MSIRSAAAAALALVVTGSSAMSHTDAYLKCNDVAVRFPDAPEPAYIVDGRAVEQLPAIEHERVESVTIMCTDEIHDLFGVEARRSGIVVFTAPGPAARLTAELDSISSRQERFHREHGRYGSLADLGWSDPDGVVTLNVHLTRDGRGWTATARHRLLGSRQPAMERSGGQTPASSRGP